MLAAASSGLVLGVAARLLMRFVALEAGVSPGYSLGGSLEVIAFGAIVGTPVAFAFLSIRQRVRYRVPWPGLALGLGMLVALTAVPPPSARSALAATPDTPWATFVGFGLLFVLWGVALDLLARHFGRSQRS